MYNKFRNHISSNNDSNSYTEETVLHGQKKCCCPNF